MARTCKYFAWIVALSFPLPFLPVKKCVSLRKEPQTGSNRAKWEPSVLSSPLIPTQPCLKGPVWQSRNSVNLTELCVTSNKLKDAQRAFLLPSWRVGYERLVLQVRCVCWGICAYVCLCISVDICGCLLMTISICFSFSYLFELHSKKKLSRAFTWKRKRCIKQGNSELPCVTQPKTSSFHLSKYTHTQLPSQIIPLIIEILIDSRWTKTSSAFKLIGLDEFPLWRETEGFGTETRSVGHVLVGTSYILFTLPAVSSWTFELASQNRKLKQ